MSLNHSPQTVTNGLVFYYDMGNPQKSWKGAPTTNAIQTNLNLYDKDNGCTVTQLSETFDGNPIYRVVFPAGTLPRIRTTFAYTTGQQYTGSIYYKVITQGTHTPQLIFRENGFGTTYASVPLNSTSWQRANITHTFSSSGTSMFLLYQSNSAATTPTTIDFSMPQTELSSFATPFVNGTRSNTQAITDLTGNNTITATALTYNNDGTFSFNGTTDFISTNIVGNTPAFTHEVFLRPTNVTKDQMYIGYTAIGAHYVRIVGSQAFLSVSAGGQRTLTHPQILSNNTNYHIVSSYDGVQLKIYVNNVLQAGPVINQPLAGWGINRIGRWQDGDQRSFVGTIFNMKSYNRALSAEEVQQNFAALRDRFGI